MPYGYGRYASRRTFRPQRVAERSAFCDPDRRLVVAWVCNGTPGEPRHQQRQRAINDAIYEDLTSEGQSVGAARVTFINSPIRRPFSADYSDFCRAPSSDNLQLFQLSRRTSPIKVLMDTVNWRRGICTLAHGRLGVRAAGTGQRLPGDGGRDFDHAIPQQHRLHPTPDRRRRPDARGLDFHPAPYRPDYRYPAILFLHGLFEAGDGGDKVLGAGLGPVIANDPENWPFITIFPQSTGTWQGEDKEHLALAALDYAQSQWTIDQDRIILAGLSYGALGVWEIGAASGSFCGAGSGQRTQSHRMGRPPDLRAGLGVQRKGRWVCRILRLGRNVPRDQSARRMGAADGIFRQRSRLLATRRQRIKPG